MGLSALSCLLTVPELVVSSGTDGNTYVHKRFSVTTIQKMVGTSGIKYLLLLPLLPQKKNPMVIDESLKTLSVTTVTTVTTVT